VSAPEMQAQIEALTAKVAALNATLGAAVSQIAALATAMVTLQAQMATGHGAVTSHAVLAALPPHNGALSVSSVLPEMTRGLQVRAIDAASVKLLDPSTSQETTLLLAKASEGRS